MRRVFLATPILLAWLAAAASAQTASTPEAPPDNPAPPPSNAAPATQAKPAKPPAPAATLETLVTADARDILGQKVSGAAGEDMGLVVDVLFDANKQPRAVVIDFGGFLGVGTRKIAVDWKLLQVYAPDSKTPLKLDLSRADVQNAPEYKPSDKSISVIAGPAIVAPAVAAPAPPSPPPASPAPATTAP
jgi:PRC-barrel domain protein